MSKLFALLLIAAIAVLIATDVVDIAFHPERLSGVPGNLAALTKDGQAPERGKILLIRTNRSIQHLFIHDREKRLELAVANVGQDAERLSETIEKGVTNADVLLPQAQLLLGSMKQVRSAAEDAPVDAVASLKQESAEAFGKAQQALAQLQALRAEYAAMEEEFQALASELESQVGTLGLDAEPKASAEAETAAEPELKF